jgi:hypothetical protein
MATQVLTAPTTALAVLYGTDRDEDVAGALASSLAGSPVLPQALSVLPGVSLFARRAIAEECARVAAPVLRIDVGEVALAGWTDFEDLRAAARSTAAEPGTTEVVPLRHHRMTSERHPRIDLLVDGKARASLWFTVAFDFDVTELAATVEAGRLVNLRSGDAELTVALSAALRPDAKGVELTKQHAKVNVPLVVRLGQGIPLQREAPQGGTSP